MLCNHYCGLFFPYRKIDDTIIQLPYTEYAEKKHIENISTDTRSKDYGMDLTELKMDFAASSERCDKY